MRILLTDIDSKAPTKPAGYKEDVLSRGRINGPYLEIDGPAYMELYRKYNPTNYKPILGSCCGKASNPPMPPITTQVRSAINTAGRVITGTLKGKPVMGDPQTVEQRKTVCNGCEFLNKEKGRCSKCGCFYQKKILLQASVCPVGKW